jgi:hypothetical protein
MGHFFHASDEEYQKQKIEYLMALLAQGSTDPELALQVREWRQNPFRPHAVARLRTTAYQKTVVMKYLDNLINWGDQLFRRAGDPEQLNEATQLYVLAYDILGRRPTIVKPRALPALQTYNQLEPKLDEFSNALVEAEALVPSPADAYSPPAEPPPVTLPAILSFCIPKNEKLLHYWDIVADRLFKIRNCLNIEGQKFELPLFEPPIEPGLLVSAAAAGLDLSSILSDVSAPLSQYRFQTVAQKATELCAEVKALGQGLLAALEKRDAETLALLRSGHEIKVLQAVRQVREKQRDEAEETLTGLKQYRELLDIRREYYENLVDEGLLPEEQSQIDSQKSAKLSQQIQAGTEFVAALLYLIPEFKVGSPTTVGITHGGRNIGSSLSAFAAGMGVTAGINQTASSLSAVAGGNRRRDQEWRHQVAVAEKELEQAERQIAAAEIRLAITERELFNHDLESENARETDAFMRDKFTNQQLYDWMVSQISSVYLQSYQLAYDVAKRAERGLRHELALDDSNFIQFGYWDSLKKGLLAGDKLLSDLKRMEAAYLDLNKREYELTKHISMGLTDPAALVQLKQTGECFLSLPEWLFDADHPGHYLRRIRSVSLTIPAIVGPYTGVNATLTLLRSTIRKSALVAENNPANYPRAGDDERFTDLTGTVRSIVTSRADNDSGLFELTFRDERYLPFEGQGAVSEWRLQLDREANRFDFNTITDVVLRIDYTAREGGESLKIAAKQALPGTGAQLLSLKHEYPTDWHSFLHPADDATSQSIVVDLRGRFPFHASEADPEIDGVDVFLKVKILPPAPAPIPLELYGDNIGDGTNLLDTDLISDPMLGNLHHTHKDFSPAKPTGEWLLRVQGDDIPAFLATTVTVSGASFRHLSNDLVQDIYLLCHFSRP